MTKLRSLWRGELPLDEAFWTWAVGVALAVNLATSVAFLALITIDRPWMALVCGYGVSVPYNVIALVGVWRSAGRHRGSAALADLARITAMVLMLILSAT